MSEASPNDYRQYRTLWISANRPRRHKLNAQDRVRSDCAAFALIEAVWLVDKPQMRFDPQAGIVQPKNAGTRRRHGRLPQETLVSNVGVVLDISAGGMRVMASSTPKEFAKIQIKGYALPGPLAAQVAWTKKRSFRKREVGYRFLDVTAKMAQALTAIAATNRFRRAI